jgi:hypothetical protein
MRATRATAFAAIASREALRGAPLRVAMKPKIAPGNGKPIAAIPPAKAVSRSIKLRAAAANDRATKAS